MEEGDERKRTEGECKQNEGSVHRRKRNDDTISNRPMFDLWKESHEELDSMREVSKVGAQEVLRNRRKAGTATFECKRCRGLVAVDDQKSVTMAGDEIEKVEKFSYLGDVLSTDGEVRWAVIGRIRAGWKKFKEVAGVLLLKGLSLKLKGLLYKSCVRSALSYGAECWATKAEDMRKMETTEMRMLRMMCGKTLKDRVRSERIREMTGVETIREFLRSQRLRWFGHVERMCEERAPVIAMKVTVNGRKRGRPKKRWEEVVKEDMKERRLKCEDAQDRSRWRIGCRKPANPRLRGMRAGSLEEDSTSASGTNG